MSTNIDHPEHYTYGSIEAIDVIESWDLDYHLGSSIKYICRAGHKGGPQDEIDDLRKAIWFLERKIALLEEQK